LSHYTAKWLPDMAPPTSSSASGHFLPPESPTATWLKKRLLLESLVAALPPDPPAGGDGCCAAAVADDGITCDFLLKLLCHTRILGVQNPGANIITKCAGTKSHTYDDSWHRIECHIFTT
jgi:hypothetical protein